MRSRFPRPRDRAPEAAAGRFNIGAAVLGR